MVLRSISKLPLLLLLSATTTNNNNNLLLVQAQGEEEDTTTTATTACTLCFGGDDPNLTNTVGGAADGVSCSVLVDNGLDTDDASCLDIQLVGYRHCDCPTYPTDHFCPMCADGFSDIPNSFQLISPGTSDASTCDDKLFVDKDGDDDSCEDAMKPGFACGCPGAEEPDCMLCLGNSDDINDSNDISNTSEDRLTVNLVGSFTCAEWVDQAMVGDLEFEQCGLVTATDADFATFCGCPGAAVVVMDDTDTPTDVPEEVADTNTTTPDAPSTTEAPTTTTTDTTTTNNEGSAAFAVQISSVMTIAGVAMSASWML